MKEPNVITNVIKILNKKLDIIPLSCKAIENRNLKDLESILNMLKRAEEMMQ